MDEMEMNINLSAIKWSWFFTAIALFAWSVYDYLHKQQVSVASFLFGMQMIVYFLISQILKSKVDDANGRKYMFSAAICILLLLAFGSLLYFFNS
jgi:hypothetical protein